MATKNKNKPRTDGEIRDFLCKLDWDYATSSYIEELAKKFGISEEKMWELVAQISHT